jgi:ATP-dependent helicase/nuclease subunit B
MKHANVFTIPPGATFLDTLVAALFNGRLIDGFDASAPFALADVTLYLPTRRSARAIRESFLSKLGRPLLLPRIRTLGDIDEDEAGLDIEAAEIPRAVPAMERQLVLTKLVLAWSGAIARSVAGFPDEELIVPASPADAARLAGSLAALIDQVGVEPEAWRGLFSGTPEDLARYWAITLEFLKIATEFWPAHLSECGLIDPGQRRDLMIRAEAARLARGGSPAPVIAAGSTGSVPATAELLKAIAHLPNGAVVLPGLDQGLDDAAWGAIGGPEPSAAGHPQYGLKLLIDDIGIRRGDVVPLGEAPASLQARDRFVSEAMRPAETTEEWVGAAALAAETKGAAIAKVGILDAANEREEALAVAVLLREATERDGAVAALVTPDRGLARRVAIELRRWGIDVDDSAGRPLGRAPSGIFARLVAEVALGGAEAETLLALLKHPLAAFGQDREDTHRAARHLERAALRGPRLRPGLAALRHAFALRRASKFRKDDDEEGADTTYAARTLPTAAWEAAESLAVRVEMALAPLEALAAKGGRIALAVLVDAHLAALRAAADDDKGRTSLFAGEAGEALALVFEDLSATAASGPEIQPSEYPELFAALIERVAVRRRGGTDPRIHIWGTLEARLQSVDKVVLGGLNEGTWPTQTRLDPLLSRPMRERLSLEPPERRIGLAAHDFAQALGAPEVWLTRADREDGEPKVASRWLQRLLAHAGEGLAKEMRERGQKILAVARLLDRPARADPSVRPAPSPPLTLRPTKLSATRIETLIRDPYAIYAQYVLKLRPFEPLAKLPDARERGILVHGILERFIGERPRGPFDAGALAQLIDVGRTEFDKNADFPEVVALWWPRFEKIARWLVATEAGRGDVEERHVEATGGMAVVPDFTLTARADRIDRRADGTLSIIDYKTGTPPSIDEVLSLSPQLPLEALIAATGGFEGIAAAPPSRLEYFQLSGRGEGGVVWDRSGRDARKGKDAVTLPQALASTKERLEALIAAFAEHEARYTSRKIPKRGRVFVGDYDHLARVAEWTTTEEEDDQGIQQP